MRIVMKHGKEARNYIGMILSRIRTFLHWLALIHIINMFRLT